MQAAMFFHWPIAARRCPPEIWWRGEGSNLRSLRQQIYSLPPLAAREPLRELVMGLEPATC